MFDKAKAVIFDMDGVLFFSTGAHERAFQETLASVGINNFSYASVAGTRTDHALRKIFSDNNRELSEEELNRLTEDKQRRVRLTLMQEGRVAPHSDELLERLAQKYRLALATSASHRTLEIYLEKSQNPAVFEFCLDGSFVKEAKPAPEIYLVALKKLGLTPEECVVIEDSVNGIQAAVNAGIKVIGIPGTDEAQALLEAGATQVVSNLKEIESLLL